MRIAIDARAWDWTGIGRYIRALVHEYAHMETKHTFVLLVPSTPDILGEVKKVTAQASERFEIHPVDGSYYSLREHVTFPLALSRVKADIFHFPHFNIPYVFNRPYVVTIHDITRLYFPGQRHQGLLRQIAYELVFSHAVANARRVICVSENTAAEIQSIGLTSHSKPVVIHEGVDQVFTKMPSDATRRSIRDVLGITTPYILVVGVWMSHKNIPRVLEAFKKVSSQFPNLNIVFTGEHKRGYVDVARLARSLGITDRVVLPGFVPDELLPALYTESSALVFASLYEGFGLPALEAAALGVPVIASLGSSLPEVMGEAAEYVNPEDSGDIARGITHVLGDTQRHAELVRAGIQQVGAFSWQRCAADTIDVYESLAS